jgi:hypothetical protein
MRTFSHSLDRVMVAFDDDRLVANAGLMAPATLAVHLGLRGCSMGVSIWVTRPATPMLGIRP